MQCRSVGAVKAGLQIYFVFYFFSSERRGKAATYQFFRAPPLF